VPLEGPVSRYVNRRISMPAARLLAATPLTPNAVSVLALAVATAAAALIGAGRNVEGGVLVQASSVVDGMDGDLARAQGRESRFGAVFDCVLDRYADAAIAAGMAWYAWKHEDWRAPLVAGLAALVGFLMVSYSRARLEAEGGAAMTAELLGLASRDVRLLLLALAAIAGQAYWGLIVVAALSYATVAWRLAAFLGRSS
jgi:phosphatidylglycerophosphate synthase